MCFFFITEVIAHRFYARGCSYSWCRAVDDLIDEAPSPEQAAANLDLIARYLDFAYASPASPAPRALTAAHEAELDQLLALFPAHFRPAFRLLTQLPLPRGPLDELVAGFKIDLAFTGAPSGKATVIATETDLDAYASNVASSVADLCVRLAWARTTEPLPTPKKADGIVRDARKMGQALQLVNIARDVPADARIGRVYLPGVSLDAVKTPEGLQQATQARRALLARARAMAAESEGAIERLPREVRGGMRAACQVYLEIGEAVEAALIGGNVGERARVTKAQRVRTAWRALA